MALAEQIGDILDTGQQNVGSVERALSVVGGATLVAHGLSRGELGGILEAVVGAALVQRGATGHCQVYSALGISTAPDAGAARTLPQLRSVRVERSFTINRPAEDLYQEWHHFERLPRFMHHLESVEVLTDTRSRWRASAPAGQHVEWEAEITEDVPGRRIAWRSLEGSDIANEGSVEFQPAPGGRGTEVHVTLEYAPPAGKVGAALAKLFREEPEQQITDDLRRFKQLMEAGETPTTNGQPAGPR